MKTRIFTTLLFFISISVTAQNYSGEQLLSVVKNNDINKIRQLIDAGANVNATDSNHATILMWAVYKCDLQTVKYLVGKKANVEAKGVIFLNDEKTSYYGNLTGIAAAEGKIEVLKYLVDNCKIKTEDKELDAETKTETGWTALQWAASSGQLEIVNYLIEKGANINANHTIDKGTPLIYALQSNQSNIAAMLIEKGADVNAATSSGITPLMLAIAAKNIDLCVLLWKNKASLTVKDNEGNTALDIAVDNKFYRGIDFLHQPDQYGEILIKEYWNELYDSMNYYYKEGNYKAAIIVGEKAVTAAKKEFGVTHENYGISLKTLALVYRKQEMYNESALLFLQATDFYKQYKGSNSLEYATALNQLGIVYEQLGDFAKTETAYKEALSATRATKENESLLESVLYNLGVFYKNKKEYKKAEPLLKEMVALQLKLYGNEHADYLDGLDMLAVIYTKNENFKEALHIRNTIAETTQKSRGESSIEYAVALNQLGILYESLKDSSHAELNYQKSLAVLQRMDKPHNLIISVLYNLADFYETQNLNSRAIELYEQRSLFVKEIRGEKSSDYAQSLNNLGVLYAKMGEYIKAEQLYLESKEIREKVLGENHPDYAQSLKNLAGLYENMGQYSKAEPLYIQAKDINRKLLGENDLNYAQCLNDLAYLYKNLGEYKKAEIFFMESKKIIKQVVGEHNPEYARSLNNLGALYVKMGEYVKAEPYYLESKAIREKVLGKNHPDVATILNNLAELYKNIGKYGMAEPLYIQSKDILKKGVGENHPQYATSLDNLAVLYNAMGKYNKAESLFIQSTEIRRKMLGENHPDFALSLSNFANLYQDMGQYEQAENLIIQSIEIRKNILGINHPDYAISLNNLATLYLKMGEFIKAELTSIQSKNILEKVLGEDHPFFATCLNNLAFIYDNMGEYTKAEPLYIRSKNIKEKILGKAHPDYAISLNSLAAFYVNIGEYSKAEPLYIQSIEIFRKKLGENHPELATVQNNLAMLYDNTGEYTKAEELYLQSMEIRRKELGERHPDYASSLNNIAALYESLGNYTKAEAFYLQAKDLLGTALGQEHPNYAYSLNNLAFLYKKIGNYYKAETFYIQAKSIRKKILGETHPDYATSLDNLARLYESMGQYEKAEPLVLQNNKIESDNLLTTFTILSENEKGIYLANKIFLNNTDNSFLFNYSKATPLLYQNNVNLQLLLKSLSLASTKNTLDDVRNSHDSSIQKLFTDWKANKSILSKQYSLPLTRRREDLKQIEEQAETLEKELTRKSSAFKNQQEQLQINARDVQKNLQQNEVAIEFVKFDLYNKKWTDSVMYAAYILTKNDLIPVFVPLCEEKQLQKLFDSAGTTATAMVSKFYRGLEVKNKNTAGALGTELYKLIWQPLEPYLKNVKKVSYSPAGKLYSIAFHALPVDSTTVLMDKYQLQQYTSTRQVVLREQEKQNSKPQSITLFGDASFTLDSLQIVKGKTKTENVSTNIYTPQNRGTRGGTWSNLPGTAQEVKTIQQLFDSNKISTNSFVQTTASEENLKALSGNSPQILHIATHGFFLPEPDKKRKENNLSNENTYTLADDPLLRSGLILAGGNYAWSGKTPIEGVEDGIATAYEISQLNLSNTELVVLSACETALGDVKGSEGVFGLQRAFKMAGVKKMIVSLWQVPDKETAELMTTFYGYWMKGKTINDAFTQAQADMRKKYAPFYWAAFVLVE